MTSTCRLNDDCLQLVFEACAGCPWTLYAVSQVCRQWYAISQLPAVWRQLTINRPSAHAAYTRFLSSGSSAQRLKNVKTLCISKPIESRHTHLKPLPFNLVPNVEHMYTFNLCLAEIEFLLRQMKDLQAQIKALSCNHIETWCDIKNFSLRIAENNPYLTRVKFKFAQDGHSGFASMHSRSFVYTSPPNNIEEFVVTSIRDEEIDEQRGLLHKLENLDSNLELYTRQEIERANGIRMLVLQAWAQNNGELLQKYKFFNSLNDMKRFEFGFCYAWTSQMWRDCFKTIVESSPQLSYLGLHGWDQLGKLVKTGTRSQTVQPFRVEAEEAIAECFESINELKSLKLVDFSVGPGLLKRAQSLSNSIQHLEIIYTKYFVKYIVQQSDAWLLIGPLKEFIFAAFSSPKSQKRTVTIRLQKELQEEIDSLFTDEPLLSSIREALQDKNVEVELLEYIAD